MYITDTEDRFLRSRIELLELDVAELRSKNELLESEKKMFDIREIGSVLFRPLTPEQIEYYRRQRIRRAILGTALVLAFLGGIFGAGFYVDMLFR